MKSFQYDTRVVEEDFYNGSILRPLKEMQNAHKNSNTAVVKVNEAVTNKKTVNKHIKKTFVKCIFFQKYIFFIC